MVIKSYLATVCITGISFEVQGLLERMMKGTAPPRNFWKPSQRGDFCIPSLLYSLLQPSDSANTKAKRFLLRHSDELWDKVMNQKSIL